MRTCPSTDVDKPCIQFMRMTGLAMCTVSSGLERITVVERQRKGDSVDRSKEGVEDTWCDFGYSRERTA